MMKVLSVVGARPQFVKLALMAGAFADAGVDHVIVHTGQHHDSVMSDVFFEDLRIPVPEVSLGIGSASHGVQTGAMLSAIEPIEQHETPDWVLVCGDTNSTLAGALAAVKLHLPVAHLEARIAVVQTPHAAGAQRDPDRPRRGPTARSQPGCAQTPSG